MVSMVSSPSAHPAAPTSSGPSPAACLFSTPPPKPTGDPPAAPDSSCQLEEEEVDYGDSPVLVEDSSEDLMRQLYSRWKRKPKRME